jgi:hypothetical protein
LGGNLPFELAMGTGKQCQERSFIVQPMRVRFTLAGGAAAYRSSGTPRGKSLEIEGGFAFRRLCGLTQARNWHSWSKHLRVEFLGR